jgi:hypothetical protein
MVEIVWFLSFWVTLEILPSGSRFAYTGPERCFLGKNCAENAARTDPHPTEINLLTCFAHMDSSVWVFTKHREDRLV